MNTQYLHADQPNAIAQAANLLRQGALVVFPTDTLYGLGADAFNAAAIDQLYNVKRRPAEKAIPVLIADPDGLDRIASAVPPEAVRLIEQFWPGPLTLILPKQTGLPANLSPYAGIAVRIPDSKVARDLIRAAGGAVATTSANLSGATPARTAEEARAALGEAVAAVLDGGPAPHSVASTIVDCTSSPARLLRSGPIPAEKLAAIL